MNKICSIEGCGRGGRITKNLCTMHYQRLLAHGDPLKKLIPDKGSRYINKAGYITITLNGLRDFEHRHIWRAHFGEIPSGAHIHHLNGIKDDNRIENLVMVNGSEHSAHHLAERNALRIWTEEMRAKVGKAQRKHATCTIEGCGKKHTSNGMCDMHNTRARRHGDPLITKWTNGCKVEGCANPHDAKGYCRTHYGRLVRRAKTH